MDTGHYAEASEAAPAVAETSPAPPKVWPSLSYHDALRAIEFLVEGLGFVKSGIYLDEQDETSVMHAELLWPEGGPLAADDGELLVRRELGRPR